MKNHIHMYVCMHLCPCIHTPVNEYNKFLTLVQIYNYKINIGNFTENS